MAISLSIYFNFKISSSMLNARNWQNRIKITTNNSINKNYIYRIVKYIKMNCCFRRFKVAKDDYVL
jgi:hypothetical protein